MNQLIRHFEVRRGQLQQTRLVESNIDTSALAASELLLRVEQFAMTANNITYAAFGEVMQYWNFFPASESGWGRIPVWGFAVVQASAHPQIAVGERIYGYFPMSSHLLIQADQVKASGFIDSSGHRQPMALVYNQYVRCAGDPGYRSAQEAEQMLLRPLFTTSFLIDDMLADNGFFGARRVMLSSASSKTAYGTAFMLAQRRGKGALAAQLDAVIGLTSPANLAFVRSLGVYDEVLSYDQVPQLPAVATVYVDMAGNAELRAAVHGHLRDALKYSCAVGGTHWDHLKNDARAVLPGPKPAMSRGQRGAELK